MSDAGFDYEFTLDDVGNAQRLVVQSGARMRWVPQRREWITYNETTGTWQGGAEAAAQVSRWAVKAVLTGMEDEANRIPPEEVEAVIALARHASRSRDERRVRAMIRLASEAPGIIKDANELDWEPDLLPVANGVINLRDGRLMPHAPSYFWTQRVEVTYDPDAEAPTFLAALETAIPDELQLPERDYTVNGRELRDWLQVAAGYAITGRTSEQVFFVVHGPGGTGKSQTFLNPLRNTLGTFGKVASAETVMLRAPGQHTEDLAGLMGKRIVTASELEGNRRMSSAVVKNVTGQEPIAARFMRQETFNFIPKFHLFQATNVWPSVDPNDTGLFRRVIAIPFVRVIPDAEKDRQLPEKLEAEAQGILTWLVRGAVRWYAKAGNLTQSGLFPLPRACVEWAEEWQRQVNPVVRFSREVFHPGDADDFVSNAQIVEVARTWYAYEGHTLPPINRFSQQLVGIGYPTVRGPDGSRGRKGIRLDPHWVGESVRFDPKEHRRYQSG